jgi:hypothetical protein
MCLGYTTVIKLTIGVYKHITPSISMLNKTVSCMETCKPIMHLKHFNVLCFYKYALRIGDI